MCTPYIVLYFAALVSKMRATTKTGRSTHSKGKLVSTTTGVRANLGGSSIAGLDFKLPLTAVSLSPDERFAAVGGREILRIVSVSDVTHFEDHLNLRGSKAKGGLKLSTNDVKWHPQTQFENILATASTNGAVVIWDIEGRGSGTTVAGSSSPGLLYTLHVLPCRTTETLMSAPYIFFRC